MNTNIRSLIGIALFTLTVQMTANAKESNLYNNKFATYYELSGCLQTPRYNETIEFCKLLDKSSNIVTYKSIGTSPQGRDIPLLILDKDGLTSVEDIRSHKRAIILIQACIHAGEPDGKDAGLMLIRDISIYGKYSGLLDKLSIIFIPIINVDGHEDFGSHYRINQNGPKEVGSRFTAQHINLNRDFIKADAPETKCFLKLYNEWLPELFIDIHVTNGADFQYVATYGIDQCGYLSENLLNWTKAVFEKELLKKMEAESIPIFPYFDYKDWYNQQAGIYKSVFPPQYSNGYASAQNRIGLLIENHIYKRYKERVEASYKVILNSLSIIAQNKDELQKEIRIADTYMSSQKFRDKPLTLQFLPNYQDSTTIDYLGWEKKTEKSDLSGADWTYYDHSKPIGDKYKIFNKFYEAVQIYIPNYYIIPSDLISTIELLDLHKIKYSKIAADTIMNLETYRFTNYEWSKVPYEGRITLTADYTSQVEKIDISQGFIIVNTNQPKIKIISNLLEPSSTTSLFYWGFYNAYVKATTEFWISLSYMETKGREMLKADNKLKEEFELKLKTDKKFAANSNAILQFFLDKVKANAEPASNRYPIFRSLGANRELLKPQILPRQNHLQ